MSHLEPPHDPRPAQERERRDGVQVLQGPVESSPEALEALRAERAVLLREIPAPGSERAPRTLSWRWFTSARPINASPLAALSVLAILLMATAVVVRQNTLPEVSSAPAASPLPDDARIVRFSVDAPEARRVALVGDFNGWDPAATIMQARNGTWSVAIPVTPGRYQYGFMIDGATWIPDPAAAQSAEADFGAANSILYVGA